MKYKALVAKIAWSWIKTTKFKSLLWKPECEIFFFFCICIRLIDTDHFALLVNESNSGMACRTLHPF